MLPVIKNQLMRDEEWKMNLKESMCRHRLVLVSWTSGTNILRATNQHRSMWSLMSSSLDAMSLALKDNLKSCLGLESDLGKTYEPNFWLVKSPSSKKPTHVSPDLDAAKSTSVSKRQTTRPNSGSYSTSKVKLLPTRQILKTSIENKGKGKGTDREFSTLTLTNKCYKS